MQIELSKKQYRDLVEFLDTANYIYGYAGDVVDDKKYKKKSDDLDGLISHVLESAKDFDSEDLVDEFDGRKFVDEEISEKHLDMIFEYDEYIAWEKIVEMLTRRDFVRKYGIEKIRKMSDHERIEKEGEIEDKYWEEVDEHGLERMEIKDDEK
ncbi:MAG: hypothetical protein ACD_8C00139G0003 [uncultured bacterium]|nr:MAG: hypothetical protein ACD_8C00139G0003 [uncultured bacterium]KKQ46182.1 MAG: hypothetical protein US63_C0005G0024 [Candidatus Moranbacteria bacterium GW2011_GWC2_37_8]KKQ62623.1 MAG: hypothetical protein US82_C0008G0005 [Parcubacteria group bacterium GW2011_GWC1_38_22]KKQ79467.1 MAG: hypothetical protein UT03_C0053G0012 [Candidatus Moranbacteria bacterium GW2011_GWD2_38_7]